MTEDLLRIINDVQEFAERTTVVQWQPELSLRSDLGFDSLDLAELTVRIQDRWGVDVFKEGGVATLGELKDRVQNMAGSSIHDE